VEPRLEDEVAQAVAALAAGKIIAMPTDTVYGLAAALDQPAAIDAIYTAKGRDAGKALPVLIDNPHRISHYAGGNHTRANRLAEAFWPGALTIVLPATSKVPYGVHRGSGTVGLRMPDNAIALAIISGAGGGLAVTSANLSGRSEARSAGEVRETLGGLVDVVVDGGPATGSIPSTVVDLTGREPVILRQGAITRRDLERVLSR
jgi:L-threonylcarbamoyladenylate synthase